MNREARRLEREIKDVLVDPIKLFSSFSDFRCLISVQKPYYY